MSHRTLIVVSLGLSLTLPGVRPLAAAEDGPTFTAKPRPPLTRFQWSLVHGRQIMLVPKDGWFYPARQAEPGILESDPPKIVVSLYGQDDARRIALNRVKSPLALTPRAWIMQRETGNGWITAETFHFDQRYFYARTAPGTFERVDMAAIRFKPRGAQ